MARLSRQTREIINIVIFLVVVGILATFYVIYPLTKTAAIMGRADSAEIDIDSLPVNNPEPFLEAGFVDPDTFRVDADGLTLLAGVYLTAQSDTLNQPKGTVILLHSQWSDRLSLIPLARRLVDSGLAVALYDQRASGLSSGRYHGDGWYEANDLLEVVSYLDIREQVIHPLTVVGFGLGADAALLAAPGENRIDQAVAVRPYLTSKRMLDIQKKRFETLWFPFYRTIMWWWYGIRSGYVTDYREIEDINPVAVRTLVMMTDAAADSPEFAKLREISEPDKFISKTFSGNDETAYDEIVGFVMD
jgi:pimeloyl-ACP methyl ester carboxylesterase